MPARLAGRPVGRVGGERSHQSPAATRRPVDDRRVGGDRRAGGGDSVTTYVEPHSIHPPRPPMLNPCPSPPLKEKKKKQRYGFPGTRGANPPPTPRRAVTAAESPPAALAGGRITPPVTITTYSLRPSPLPLSTPSVIPRNRNLLYLLYIQVYIVTFHTSARLY